jgi:predicted Zn finger-like uncharacterized protein
MGMRVRGEGVMEVTCEHCKAKLNIPDEKIPKGQVVKIGCPKCKNKITLDTREGEQAPATTPESQASGKSDEKAYDYNDFSDDEDLGFLEEGTKLALILDNSEDNQQKFRAAMNELGYRHVRSPNSRDAIGKLRFHHFDLVVVGDGFDGQQIGHSPIVNYVNHVTMSERRRMFVALMSSKYKTMDNMMAFAMSANLVINDGDIENVTAILKKAISENERFYKVFMDTLVEAGKA